MVGKAIGPKDWKSPEVISILNLLIEKWISLSEGWSSQGEVLRQYCPGVQAKLSRNVFFIISIKNMEANN
jgi:hypothetical protein